MNSLSLGFFYICGLTLLLVDVCLSASAGNWTPLTLFTIFFTVMFAVLGCVKISSKAVDSAGPIFAILIGVGILAYAIASIQAGFLGAFLRLLMAAAMIGFGAIGFLVRPQGESHESH